jgi:hypothetical protein
MGIESDARRLQDADKRIRWRPREQAIASAAGTPSRRLQYPSKDHVDFSRLPGTAVEGIAAGNCCRLNALAPEVARHQQVDDRAEFAFDSRRFQNCKVFVCGISNLPHKQANDAGGLPLER